MELPCLVIHRANVTAMVGPPTIAWAKLLDAAAVRIDNFTGGRIRAFIKIVDDAILVGVNGENLPSHFVPWDDLAVRISSGHVYVKPAREQFIDLVGAERKPPFIVYP